MLYLPALVFPPLALLWCRRPGAALLALGAWVALVVEGVNVHLGDFLPAAGALALGLWAVGAVAARGAAARAARRIREAWGPPGPGSP